MSIDKPLDQAEVIIASEERLACPVPNLGQLASLFSDFAQAKAAFCSGHVGEAIATAASTISALSNAISDDNSQYLLKIVISELRWAQDRIEELDQVQREFMGRDWISLFADANRKVREARTKSKVERIAVILCNSAIAVPVPKPDDIEELMRMAVILSDDDVTILRLIFEGQISSFNKSIGRTDFETANNFWARLNGPNTDPIVASLMQFSEGQRLAICAKLQSLGLLVQSERNQMKLPPGATPYGLLEKAVRFMEFIRRNESLSYK